MSTLTIREARPGDIDVVYDIFSETDRSHRDAHPEIFRETVSVSKIKDYYLSCIKNPDAIIFVAEQQYIVIGALISALQTSPDIPVLVPRKFGCIENITVLEKNRRQGIGEKLITYANRWAIEKGAIAMELIVWEFNQGAAEFYQRIGFHTSRRRMIKDLP